MHYFQSLDYFKFIFTLRGKLINYFNELPPNENIVIVSPNSHFQGIKFSEMSKSHRNEKDNVNKSIDLDFQK